MPLEADVTAAIYDVDGRVSPTDTLVALARGSGVSLIRFRRTDSVELELLADVNAEGLMHRVWVRDSLLYVGSAAGLEIWHIADERSPIQREPRGMPIPDGHAGDVGGKEVGGELDPGVGQIQQFGRLAGRRARPSGLCTHRLAGVAAGARRACGVDSCPESDRRGSGGLPIPPESPRGQLLLLSPELKLKVSTRGMVENRGMAVIRT